jgi:hypothetical protein
VCLVVTKPLATHAFAAPASCTLSLEANPGSVGLHSVVDRDYSIEEKISGALTCGGTGLRGATIVFPPGSLGQDKQITFTDNSGNYHSSMHAQIDKSYTIDATYAGDSEHSGAAARTEITIYYY